MLDFERRLREEEDWGWEIDDAYISAVEKSFDDRSFDGSVSLLAYVDGKVVGRIDACLLASRFDGSKKAYLDWICVLKSPARGRGPAADGGPERDAEGPAYRPPHRPHRRQ